MIGILFWSGSFIVVLERNAIESAKARGCGRLLKQPQPQMFRAYFLL
jgi:hypothetical protein